MTSKFLKLSAATLLASALIGCGSDTDETTIDEGLGITGWVIQSADGTYAKVIPTKLNENGTVQFNVELWTGSSWAEAEDSGQIDYYGYAGQNSYYDFDSNASGGSDTQGWDIYVKNTNHYPEILLADGASVAQYTDSDEEDNINYRSVDQLDHPTTPSGASIYNWYTNNTGNALKGPGNLGPIEYYGDYTNISYDPTYTTYLIKEDDTYYKVQFLGYKGADGDQGSGNFVIRQASKTDGDLAWSSTIQTDNLNASTSGTIAAYDLISAMGTTVNSMDEIQGDWHFAYKKHRGFEVNGGINGQGNGNGEVASCIAYEYPDLFDDNGDRVLEELAALNADNTLTKFEELEIDACDNFSVDVATTPTPIGSDWFSDL